MSDDARPASFGWVVDDGCPYKSETGGPQEFAIALTEGRYTARCDATGRTCGLLGDGADGFGCVGIIEAPISVATEQWLIGRLPASIESLPGQLLRQNLKEGAVTGRGGASLRAAGLLEANKPFERHYGPFFRGVTVTSDQLIEQMLCAGHVQPPHALAVLLHLGGVAVDDAVLESTDDGPKLASLVKHAADRAARTLCTIAIEDDDDRSTVELKRFLRGLYAAFVQDTEVRVFGGPA